MIWFVDDEDENNDVSIFMEMDVHCVQGPFQQEIYHTPLSSNDDQSHKVKIQIIQEYLCIVKFQKTISKFKVKAKIWRTFLLQLLYANE